MKPRSMELMLAGWHKDHSAGTKVTFWINDEDLEYFENMTVKKGKTAGQRLVAALVEIGDDEQPVPHETKKPSTSKFPGGLCGLAVRWCADPHFQAWLENEMPKVWLDHPGSMGDEEIAKHVICTECGVSSRSELDTNRDAADNFRQFVLEPYKAQRKADGFVDA